jgi:hypothetical protein
LVYQGPMLWPCKYFRNKISPTIGVIYLKYCYIVYTKKLIITISCQEKAKFSPKIGKNRRK